MPAVDDGVVPLIPGAEEFRAEGQDDKVEADRGPQGAGRASRLSASTATATSWTCRGAARARPGIMPRVELLAASPAPLAGRAEPPDADPDDGTAWVSTTDLTSTLSVLESARAHDHRVLGPALDLFGCASLGGMPCSAAAPGGSFCATLAGRFWRELQPKSAATWAESSNRRSSTSRAVAPSGHYENYHENMFIVRPPSARTSRRFVAAPDELPRRLLVLQDTAATATASCRCAWRRSAGLHRTR